MEKSSIYMGKIGDFGTMEEKLILAHEAEVGGARKTISSGQLMSLVEQALQRLPQELVDDHLENVYDVLYDLAEAVAHRG